MPSIHHQLPFWAGLLPLLLLLPGCKADTVDMGDEEGAAGAAGGAAPGATETWSGYIENHTFPSGSDLVTVVFETRSTAAVTGTVVLGEGTPPPVDPSVGYPPVEPPDDPMDGSHDFIEGFPFTILDGTMDGARVQFAIARGEQYTEWCEGQNTYQITDELYHCVPGTSGGQDDNGCFVDDPETGGPLYFDCGVIGNCIYPDVCACDAQGCTGSEVRSVSFDLSFDGDSADGSASGLGSGTLRLTRTD